MTFASRLPKTVISGSLMLTSIGLEVLQSGAVDDPGPGDREIWLKKFHPFGVAGSSGLVDERPENFFACWCFSGFLGGRSSRPKFFTAANTASDAPLQLRGFKAFLPAGGLDVVLLLRQFLISRLRRQRVTPRQS